jgi:hypothetical protein
MLIPSTMIAGYRRQEYSQSVLARVLDCADDQPSSERALAKSLEEPDRQTIREAAATLTPDPFWTEILD